MRKYITALILGLALGGALQALALTAATFATPDGSASVPAYTFLNEATSGLYRGASSDIRLAVSGVDMVRAVSGGVVLRNQMRGAQVTAPTCTTNCGTGATVSGSDSAGIITVGTTPANGIVLVFNATWTAAPSCTATQQTTTANTVSKVLTTTTQATITFAAGPTASDLVSYHCIGVS